MALWVPTERCPHPFGGTVGCCSPCPPSPESLHLHVLLIQSWVGAKERAVLQEGTPHPASRAAAFPAPSMASFGAGCHRRGFAAQPTLPQTAPATGKTLCKAPAWAKSTLNASASLIVLSFPLGKSGSGNTEPIWGPERAG